MASQGLPNANDEKTQELDDETKTEESTQESSNITVCVTGASGFIASHVIKQLLEKGYNVIGTVRGDPLSDKYKWLDNINTKNANKIELYKAELQETDIFLEAFKRCDYIFHVASPVLLDTTDPLNDLVEPAKNGTLNVLNCCSKANQLNNNKIKRIIITSSVSTINGKADPTKIYTEQDWNEYSSLTSDPYGFSKVEAERATWQWMEDNKQNDKITFDLITLHPAFVVGKNFSGRINESNGLLPRIVNGFFPVRINVAFNIVDVRDVAAAHIYFIEDEKAIKEGKGRYIVSGQTMALSEIMDHCEEYCNKNDVKEDVPCCRCDCKCCWCFIMCIACCKTAGEAEFMRTEVNRFRYYSNEKLLNLGFEYQYKDAIISIDYALDYLKECGFIAS